MVCALANTGAQLNLWWKNFQDAGFGKNDLLPVSVTIWAANKISINTIGASQLLLVECLRKMRQLAAIVLFM